MSAADREAATARPDCEHYWAWVSPAGTRKSARICMTCHEPDPEWLNHTIEVDLGHPRPCVHCEFAPKALAPVQPDALAEAWPRMLSVPDEDSLYTLLAAFNYGANPELACAWDELPFIASLTDPDADYVRYTRTDEAGRTHCCTCVGCSDESVQAHHSWTPRYPVTALVPEMPNLDRADEDGLDVDWLRALLGSPHEAEGGESVGPGPVGSPHNGGDCQCWCEGDTYESEGATFCALCNHEMPRPAATDPEEDR